MPMNSKAKKALIISATIVGGLATGFGAGFLIGHFAKPKQVDLSNVDPNAFEDNNDNLLTRYNQCKSDGGEPSEEFTIPELANIALMKFESSEHSCSYGYGTVKSAVNLDIRNATIRNGNEFMEESLSKSAAGAIVNVIVAQRDYQHLPEGAEGSNVDSYVGTVKDNNVENADWSNATQKNYTTDAYEDTFGKPVSRTSVYIISSKSVLSDGTSIEKTDDGYTITMNMDTTKSIVRYVKRMMNISNSQVNSFEYVRLTYHVDSDFNLISTTYNERYAAGMGGVSATCTGELNTYYFTGSETEIPAINTNTIYPEEGGK